MLDVANTDDPLKKFDSKTLHQELMPLIGRLVRIRYMERSYAGEVRYYDPKLVLHDFAGELHDVTLAEARDGRTQLAINVGKKKEVLVSENHWVGVYQRDSGQWQVIYEPLLISIDSAKMFEKKDKENAQ